MTLALGSTVEREGVRVRGERKRVITIYVISVATEVCTVCAPCK